ncbi:type I methionyl aminopeptidase [Paraoerskovia marina]|uniref:type I methionyl aminopeptidase n=1 Tax=Paraoerskovia marina TaxID=545619 RepID=UPI0004929578|nr:type I methionyl aminopeptidase [Paraoerskovia marina]
MFGREKIEYKSLDEVRTMRRAGLVVAQALAAVRKSARPGMTTADLDQVAAATIHDAGATSNFLGYHGFPATVCASVNEEIVHGIPGSRVLEVGDVVSVDCGAVVDGWHGDSALSFILGPAGALDIDDPAIRDSADADLVRITEESMWAGIAALATASRVGEIGDAIDDVIAAAARDGVELGIVTEFTGHGIGTAMHQPPEVLNFRSSHRGPRVKPGMCLAIEPMMTRGSGETVTLADDWTVVTGDGSRAAHWEHSVAVTEQGISVLTAPDAGAERLANYGVVPVTI